MQAETEAAFQLAFYVAELTGLFETGESNEEQARLLRLLTPLMKLTTAKQSVMLMSEVLEAFGGAGYVEDTGLPVLLRDAQVLPIWEGTTNVLSLDALRALGTDGLAFQTLKAEVCGLLETARLNKLAAAAHVARLALEHAESWLAQAKKEGQAAMEAGARSFAMTLGRTIELALLIRHAQWSQEQEGDERATAAARRFASSGVDLLNARDPDDARVLFAER